MASSSDWKATSSRRQRFNGYLDGLREEFERRPSNDTSTKNLTLNPCCFNICLRNLEGEFELMALEIESLRKDREDYREKFEAQAKDLQNLRIRQGCSNGTPPSSRPILQSNSLHKLSTSSRVVNPAQQAPTTVAQGPHSAITSTRPSQFVSHTMNNGSDAPMIFAHSRPPSPLSQASAPTVDPEADAERCVWSIAFNNQVEKKLDVEIAHTLFHGKKTIWCVKFSQDGKYLAAGCDNGKAYVYNTQTGTLSCVLKDLLAEDLKVGPIGFSREGKYLATGSYHGSLYIWEINTKYVRNAFKGHTRCINSLEFSPNGRLLVSASDDNTVRLWDMRSGAAKFLTEDNPTILDDPCYGSPVFTPDGRYVAASHRDGVVRIWGVLAGQLLRRVKAHMEAYGVTFMPDGKALVTGSRDTTLKYWDVSSLYTARLRPAPQTMNDSRRESTGVQEQIRPEREFLGHEGFVYSVAISPDGRWVASSSHDKSVRIWDTRNAAMQCSLKNDQAKVCSVDFSPAGRYLASGGSDGAVRIWSYSCITFGGSGVQMGK